MRRQLSTSNANVVLCHHFEAQEIHQMRLRGEVDMLKKAHARVEHDLYYIEHWSPWLDLKILLKTVGNSCLA
jgi:lipopolysaccharide/colanic/teichoic acid biosynthesis glycosyltransferase